MEREGRVWWKGGMGRKGRWRRVEGKGRKGRERERGKERGGW
jgi:hypothetical protein